MVLSTININQVLEQAGQEKARRLAALERAQALGERIRAERSAHDVDSVELLRQVREERTDVLAGGR
jgi:hypothetical protein